MAFNWIIKPEWIDKSMLDAIIKRLKEWTLKWKIKKRLKEKILVPVKVITKNENTESKRV